MGADGYIEFTMKLTPQQIANIAWCLEDEREMMADCLNDSDAGDDDNRNLLAVEDAQHQWKQLMADLDVEIAPNGVVYLAGVKVEDLAP